MTQERVNNNNSYAFVLEDPSKPRKYQLNFNLDTEYVKEPAQMDQSISHHQYNPQHNHQQQQQRQVPSQVTLPSIRELIPIPPPVPQVTPSAHRHPYHHQPYPYQKQQESLMTSSARPHLPPLQPSVMETPSNPPAFNYTQSVFPNQNNMIQSDKSDRGFHERMDQPNLHPSSIQPSLPVADVYSSHQNYPSPHFIANNQHQQPIPPSRNHHYPTNNNNNNNNSNNTTTSQSSSSNHVSHQRLQHQSYQQIQQQQHNQQTQHHHHNHHHNNHQQQQQNLSQTHHYQQKHHHPVITNNSSPSSTVSQSYQSNVYSNEIERSQHDLQSASTVRPPYNAHNRQSYYSQVYPGSSPPPPPPPHSNHSISQQQKQSPVPPPPLPLSIPPQQMISQSTISAPSSDLLSNRNGSSADLSVVHPQPNTDRRFIQRDPINSLHNVHEQQQISPQSQPYKLSVQPPPLSDLLNPPRSISRPVTPPPSQSQSQAPSQQPPLISRDNRETFPYLAPPPHHQSGSNSSVSTRSSSPVPTTPVANSNSNNNVSYSPHHSPNNNMVPVQIDKPIAEQNASQPKRRGRSQKPRPIVPAGPLPNQQSVISSQVQPQSSATNDTPVFVQYVIPTSNNNGTVDTSSHLPPASKSLYATRPRKNSSVGGGNVSSVPKRPRKQKDNSNVLVNDTHVIGEENKNNKQLSDSLQLPSAVTNNPEGSLSSSFTTMSTNPRASTIPNRKREHPAPSSPRNTSKIKRCKKDENFDDDVMMEDASAIRNVNIKNSSDEAKSSPSHMEAVFILQSLKEGEGSNSPPTEVVTSPSATPDIVGVKGEITKQVSEEPKVDQFENLVATKVRELSLDETDQFKGVDNVTVKSPLILSKDPAKNSVTGEAVKPTLTSNKTKKKGFNGGNNSRNDPTNKVNRTRQMPSVAISDQNAGNDSDNDLAMDDGSDDEEYAKRNQPISNNNVDDSVQWNSDEMETEEEVEEEVVIFENTEVKDEGKSTFVSSPPPLPSLPPSTASHPNLVRTKNENCSDALSTTSSATHITTANSKNSRPASPITSNCGNASSLVSRKGSISSNGSNKDKDVFSDVLDMPLASPSPSTITSNHITNGSGRPQRPCPPRRRSTMRDDEKLELGAIEWEKNIEIPQHIWEETLRVFEIVKHSKEMKNRQPHRKRNHILASILFILCRQNGLPRTFVEICNAASIRKQEIGSYYRLMLKVFESNGLGGGSNGTVDSAEYLKRWCQNLKLPSHILDAAIHVYKQASELNITTGKCPVSVGAASIWLSISSWNEIRSSWNSNEDNEQIKCEHKDVAQAAGVVNATLVGCFKNLSKYKDQLLPAEFLQEAKTRPPYNHKKIDFSEGNPGNNSTVENDCRDDKKTTFFSSTPSLENLKFYGPPLDEDEEVAENDKTKVETIKVENVKVEPTTPTISSLPNKVDSITSPRSKSLQLESKNCKTENSSSNPVKAEPTHSPFKEIKPEKSSVASKNTVPEPQDDADDELEEGELREDCDDAMMD